MEFKKEVIMGADCHCHIEVKIDNKWEHYSVPNIQRNYTIFEKMAGVRGDVANAISPPRGLPKDISLITKIDADNWGEDTHSHSWLSSEEFKELYEYQKYHYSYIEQYGYLFGNGFESFKAGDAGYPKDIQDFRLVFWFDN